MSTVTMPEPVAIAYETKDGGVIFTATTYGAITLKRGDSVITTTQAEAYAAAKVREALEEAATTCTNSLMMATDSYCGATAHYCADRIRALIPPLPGPVEPSKENT